MKFSKFIASLFFLMISTVTFAGHYPAKVNSDLTLYADLELSKSVILVKEGVWLNTMPTLISTEVRYGMTSLYISEQDTKKLVDVKPFELEKGIFDDGDNTSSPNVLIQKDTPIYNQSVLEKTEAEIKNMPTLLLLKATDMPCPTFKEVVGKSGKTFYKISFNDEPSYILKEDTSIIHE